MSMLKWLLLSVALMMAEASAGTIVSTLSLTDTWNPSSHPGYQRTIGPLIFLQHVAWSFIPASDVTTIGAQVALGRCVSATYPDSSATVSLYDDAAAPSVDDPSNTQPGTLLATGDIHALQGQEAHAVPLPSVIWPATPLVGGARYWIAVTAIGLTHGHWLVGEMSGVAPNVCPQGRVGSGKTSPDAVTWTTAPPWYNCSVAFRILSP